MTSPDPKNVDMDDTVFLLNRKEHAMKRPTLEDLWDKDLKIPSLRYRYLTAAHKNHLADFASRVEHVAASQEWTPVHYKELQAGDQVLAVLVDGTQLCAKLHSLVNGSWRTQAGTAIPNYSGAQYSRKPRNWAKPTKPGTFVRVHDIYGIELKAPQEGVIVESGDWVLPGMAPGMRTWQSYHINQWEVI